jgi:hypothetical protein
MIDGFVSPRLGVRFDFSGPELVVRYPDGRPFLTFTELAAVAEQAQQTAEKAQQAATQAKQEVEQSRHRETRLAELTRKVLEQAATPEELAEVRRLIEPPPPTT